LISRSIKASEVIAYEELGPEAIRRMRVENLPTMVINDTRGGDLYQEGIRRYQQV
jgi:fumarate hydratase subunit beta